MKTFRILGTAALCAVLAPALASCGDDDDEPGGDGTGGVVEIEGERLSSVAGVTIDYDSKGRVSKLTDNYGNDWVIDYAKGTLKGSDSDPEDNYKVKFNGKGYIAELKSSWSYTETEGGDKYSYNGSGTVSFSYNGSGCLTKVTSSMSGTGKNLTEGISGRFSESYTITLTWKDGNLVKAVEKGTENDNGDKDTWRDDTTIDYSSTPNEYRQLTFAVSGVANNATVMQVLGAAGLFGKGTAELPSCVSSVDEEGYSSTSNCSYTLRPNGSVSIERDGYNTYYYNYEEISRGFASADAAGLRLSTPRAIFARHSRR